MRPNDSQADSQARAETDLDLGTVGRCIYCLQRDGPLSTEHIVPYGLDGRWFLREASCTRCAGITSAVEREVLRRAAGEFRSALGLPTRRRGERVLTFPVTLIYADGTETDIDLTLADHEYRFAFHLFDPPGWLHGEPVRGITFVGYRTVLVRPRGKHARTLEDVGRDAGAAQVRQQSSYKSASLARMIAKIAYGFGVAIVGLDAFEEVYVTRAILGQRDDIGTWVGNVEPEFPHVGDVRHQIALNVIPERVLVATVKLLADFGGPEYAVVIGRVSRTAAQDVMRRRTPPPASSQRPPAGAPG